MKTRRLPPLGTISPNMFCRSVMKNKEIKKIQFGGWKKQNYKFIRQKIKRIIKKDIENEMGILV